VLDRDGLAPKDTIDRFLGIIGERDLFSDEPEFEAHWLSMLADAATISLGARKIVDARKLLEQAAVIIEPGERPRHRAEADARRLALAFVRAVTPGSHTENPIRTVT
jgi:hypothetical protein